MHYIPYSTCRGVLTITNCLADHIASAWLQMKDDVMISFGEPTWSALATALDEIGQDTVASTIRANGGKEGNTLLSLLLCTRYKF